jgi:hypothetical protein
MPTHQIPLSSLAAIGTVTVQDTAPTTRPTAFAVMCLSGVEQPTLTRVPFFETLRAVDAKVALQAKTTMLAEDDVLMRALPLAGVNETGMVTT